MFSSDVVRQISTVAEKNNVELAALLAVADIESAGIAFWTVDGKQVPAARPEGHYFYKYLTGAKRTQAIREGLANPKAGALKVPANRIAVYARIQRMIAVDEDAAYKSCSWGLGQVMGANAASLGYASAKEMVNSMSSVAGQVEAMWRFIKVNHLDDEIKRHDWKGFARGYNGAGYAKNAYDKQMAKAYNRYKTYGKPATGVFQKDTPDPTILLYQGQLAKLGYPTPTTGKPDAAYERAVRAFQTDKGLVPDGIVGTATRDALIQASKEKNSRQGDKLVGAGIATGGVDATVDKLSESSMGLQYLANGSDLITYLLLGLTVLTVGLVCYGLYKKFKGAQ